MFQLPLAIYRPSVGRVAKEKKTTSLYTEKWSAIQIQIDFPNKPVAKYYVKIA